MILIKILCVWIAAIEITLCFSPGVLMAIAKVNTAKAKAKASAINWKIKNAMGKSKKHKSLKSSKRYARETDSKNIYPQNIEKEYGESYEIYGTPYDYQGIPPSYNNRVRSVEEIDDDIPIFYQHFPNFHEKPGKMGFQFNDKSPNYEWSFDDSETNLNFAMDKHKRRDSLPILGNPISNKDEKLANEPAKEEQKTQNSEVDQKARFFQLPLKKPLVQPEYQNPYDYDPYKPEDKKDMVQYLDKQNKYFGFPKKEFDEIDYHVPEKDKYDEDYTPNGPYGYTIPRHYPIPHPVKILPHPVKILPDPGKENKLLDAKHDAMDNLVEILHEKGDLLFDMLRPLATHLDTEVLNKMEHLDYLKHLMEPAKQVSYLSPPLQPPDVHYYAPRSSSSNDSDPIVGYIIHVPRNSRRIQRFKRSVASSSDDGYLYKLIDHGSEAFKALKRIGGKDEQIVALARFGNNVMEHLRNKIHKKQKRSVQIDDLLTDPSTKIDVSKVLENLGTFAKRLFEHQDTPMLHVRNLVGSTKDTVLATMKIPNQNFITPSNYDIIDNEYKDEPEIVSRSFGDEPDKFWPQEMVTNTFQQVGQVIRNSVRSGQEAINHVGEITNHAKKAIISAQKAPDVIMETLNDPIPLVSASQPVSIKSRFGEDQIVGDSPNAKTKPDGKFINIGHLLDAVGISNPRNNPNSIENDDYINEIHKKLDGMKFVEETTRKLKELRDNKDPWKVKCTSKREVCRGLPEEMVGMSFIPQELTHPFMNMQDFGRREADEIHFDSFDEHQMNPGQEQFVRQSFM